MLSRGMEIVADRKYTTDTKMEAMKRVDILEDETKHGGSTDVFLSLKHRRVTGTLELPKNPIKKFHNISNMR